MKILFFAPPAVSIQNEKKGSGNWVSALIEALKIHASQEIQLFVALFDTGVEVLSLDEIDGVTYARIPVKNASTTFTKYRGIWFSQLQEYEEKKIIYKTIVDKVRPDLIQLFGIEHDYISILGEIQIPAVIHLQGMRGPYWLKAKSNRRYKVYKSLRKIISDVAYERKINWKLSQEERIYPHIQYFFGRTDWDRYFAESVAPEAEYMYCQEIMRSLFYDTSWSIPGQNNTSGISGASGRPIKGSFRIYSTLSGNPRKNVDILYRADILLRKYQPDFNVTWKIGGLTTSSKMYKILRRSGLESDRVELLGRLNASEIIDHMRSSHLYVFPSSIDNSPNSLQEAMLLGMPVIATHAGGVSSLIEHNVTGMLIPEGEPYALAGAVSELSRDRDKMIRLGKNARKVSLQRNDPASVVKSLMNGYTKMLNT